LENREKNKEENKKMVLAAYTCNPNYLGGRNQEDHGLKAAQANSSQDPIRKTQHKNRVGSLSGSSPA
jgi:hypothetical protein